MTSFHKGSVWPSLCRCCREVPASNHWSKNADKPKSHPPLHSLRPPSAGRNSSGRRSGLESITKRGTARGKAEETFQQGALPTKMHKESSIRLKAHKPSKRFFNSCSIENQRIPLEQQLAQTEGITLATMKIGILSIAGPIGMSKERT